MNRNWFFSIILVIIAAVVISIGFSVAARQVDVDQEMQVNDITAPGVLQWSRNVECKDLGEGRIWCDVKRDQP